MKYFLTFYLIFIGSLLVNAQEIDDMYFTSTDRESKKKLSKKSKILLIESVNLPISLNF